MIFESEFLILAMLVFSATAAAWWFARGPAFSLADLTIVEPRAKSATSKSAHKSAHNRVLLPGGAVSADAGSHVVASPGIPNRPGDMPLDTQTQLNRVSIILQNAIDLAANAESLHNAAHEKLDSAHYALQNLLDELSAVMPIASPSKAAIQPASPSRSFPPERPVYVTALAA